MTHRASIRFSNGFTLIEVMVVLMIIGLMIGMATLSPSGNEKQEEAMALGLKIKSLMNAYRDDAVFYNKDLGLALDGENLLLLEYFDLRDPGITKNLEKEQLAKIKQNPWAEYSGKLESEVAFDEPFYFTAEIEGEPLDLNLEFDEKKGPEARMGFLASDEYTPFKIFIANRYDETFQVVVKGNGLGSISSELIRYEE